MFMGLAGSHCFEFGLTEDFFVAGTDFFEDRRTVFVPLDNFVKELAKVVQLPPLGLKLEFVGMGWRVAATNKTAAAPHAG